MSAALGLFIFGASFLLIGLDFTKVNRKYKEYIFNLFCFILIVVAGAKTPATSYDTNNYVLLYESVSPISRFIPFFSGYEPGWELLCILCKTLGFSYNVYFTIISSIVICIYRYVILKKCNNIFIALFTYISCFYFLNEIIVLRHGLASAIIFLELYFLAEGKLKKAFCCAIVAFSFHMVGIFGFIPFLIKNKKISSTYFLIIFFAMFFNDRIFINLLIQISQMIGSSALNMAASKITRYVGHESAAGGIKTLIVYSIPFLLSFVVLHNNQKTNAYIRESSLYMILAAFFMLSFSAVASFSRINQLFLTGNISMSSFYLDEFKKKRAEAIIIPIFLAVNTYIFFRQNFFNSGGNIFH